MHKDACRQKKFYAAVLLNFTNFHLRSFVPLSFFDSEAKRRGDTHLVPSKKVVTIPLCHCSDLIKTLQSLLPDDPSKLRQESRNFFGEFSYPRNSTVYFLDGTKAETSNEN